MLAGHRLQKKVHPTATLFRAAGSDTRLAILYMLLREPLDLGTIIRRLKVSPGLAAHHLKALSLSGWVTRSKFGKLVTYYLSESAVKDATLFFKKP